MLFGRGRVDRGSEELAESHGLINLHLSMSAQSRHIAKIARALSEPARVRLLQELAQRGSMLCMEVQRLLRLAQPTVSHHIKTLAEAGLIETERQGRHLRIRLNSAAVEHFCRWLQVLVERGSVTR